MENASSKILEKVNGQNAKTIYVSNETICTS